VNAPAPTIRPPLRVTDAQYEDMARRGAFATVGRVELRRGVITPMSPAYMPPAGAPTADIVVFSPAAIGDESGPLPGNAARLIVEVAAASLADDLGEKLVDYARFGLAEYWVADVRAA